MGKTSLMTIEGSDAPNTIRAADRVSSSSNGLFKAHASAFKLAIIDAPGNGETSAFGTKEAEPRR
jgi:hypothetical protein